MLKTAIDIISTRSIWLHSWTLFDITGVRGGLLLNIGFVLKWTFLLLKPLLTSFDGYSRVEPSNSRKKVYVHPHLWKHCRRMRLYHLLCLFEALCCFLFTYNNPISFTALQGIINTWKNEKKMNIPFLGSNIPFFHCCSFFGDILGPYLHDFTSIFRHISYGQLQQATV